MQPWAAALGNSDNGSIIFSNFWKINLNFLYSFKLTFPPYLKILSIAALAIKTPSWLLDINIFSNRVWILPLIGSDFKFW